VRQFAPLIAEPLQESHILCLPLRFQASQESAFGSGRNSSFSQVEPHTNRLLVLRLPAVLRRMCAHAPRQARGLRAERAGQNIRPR
jgi:hypothetical protein